MLPHTDLNSTDREEIERSFNDLRDAIQIEFDISNRAINEAGGVTQTVKYVNQGRREAPLASAPVSVVDHAATHITGAGDELDGDAVDIDYTPTSYTGTDRLDGHLAGINTRIGESVAHIADASKHFLVSEIDHGLTAGLSDDDHTQYQTEARANTWLATKSTTDIAEGTNLYYTAARVISQIGATVTKGFVELLGISHASTSVRSADDHTQYQTEARANTWLATKSTTDIAEGTNLYYTAARVISQIGATVTQAFVASLGIPGNDKEVQFNDGGLQAGEAAFTYDKTTKVLGMGAVQFDIGVTPPTAAAGLTYWDADNKTLSTVLENGVVGQHFEESFISGQNDTGDDLEDGTVATYAGSIGNSGNIRIAATVASASEPAFMTIGIVTQTITDADRGKVTTSGKVRGIQTNGANYSETWVDADILYKSSTIAGGLTKVPPQAPIPAIPIAVVISAHASNGTLLVRPTFPQALTMLTDVNGTPTTTDGQMLTWHNTEGYFDFDDNINRYILASGVRAFTGVVAGITPVLDAHLSTKGYVDAGDFWARIGATLNPKTSTDEVEWSSFKYQDATTGALNTLLIGELAGRDNTGDNNTFIGKSAGVNNTSGEKNVALGKSALSSNLTGSNNFAMGTDAAKATTSQDCFALGASALLQNIVGSANVAIGTEAGRGLKSSHNTVIGHNAMRANQRYQNTAIGYQVGYANSNGGANCMFGYRAGYNSTGTKNVYIGHSAGYNATGDNLLFISNSDTATPLIWGDFAAALLILNCVADGAALQNQPTGGNALAIATTKYSDDGDFWARVGTTLGPKTVSDKVEWRQFKYQDATTGGSDNLFVGEVGNTLNTGDQNTFVGSQAGEGNMGGSNNLGSGYQALKNNQTGINNMAIGTFSQLNNISGSRNVGLGVFSLYSATNRAGNVGVGYATLFQNTIGHDNTAIGDYAGRAVQGFRNVLIGHDAGRTATTIDDELWICNSTTLTPLIWGDFAAAILKIHGDLKIPSDTKKLFLGAGDDLTLEYDGTNAILNAAAVAPSDLKVNCGTDKTLELVEVVWDDQQVNIAAVGKGSSAPNDTDYRGGFVLSFANSQPNKIKFTAQLTHKYKVGANIEFHVHTTVPGTGAGNVSWTLTHSWAATGQKFPVESSVTGIQTIAANSDDLHMITDIADPIVGSSIDGISSLLICSLTRDGSDVLDTYAGEVYITAVDFHIPLDTVGSRTEMTK